MRADARYWFEIDNELAFGIAIARMEGLAIINFKPVAGVCPHCDYPLLIEKKTAQGLKRFCASKQCGKPVSADQISE